MNGAIQDTILAAVLLLFCGPMFAWFSELADDPETKYGSTSIEMVFAILMVLSLIGGCIVAFNAYWAWADNRTET